MYRWCFFLLVLSLLQLATLERRYNNERDICSNRYLSIDEGLTSYGKRDAESIRSPYNCPKRERERLLIRRDTTRNNYERAVQRNVYTRNIDLSSQRMRLLFRERSYIRSDPVRTDMRRNRFVRNAEIDTRRRDMIREYNKENKDTRITMGNRDDRQYGKTAIYAPRREIVNRHDNDRTLREAQVTRRHSVNIKLNEIRSNAQINTDRAVRTSDEERRTRDNRERMNILERTFRHSSARRAIDNLQNSRMIQEEIPEARFSTERVITTRQRQHSRQYSSNNRDERQESRSQRSRSLVSRDRVLAELRHHENARDVVRNERNSLILTRDRHHLKREYSVDKESDYNTREIRLNRSQKVPSRMRVTDELRYDYNTRENTARNTRRSQSPSRERQLLAREHGVSRRSSDNTRRVRLDTLRNLDSRERVMDESKAKEATRQETVRSNLHSMHRHLVNEEVTRREIRQDRFRALSRQRVKDELNEVTGEIMRMNSRARESQDQYNYRSRRLLSRERNVNELNRNENKGERIVRNRSRSLTMTRERDVRMEQRSKTVEDNIRYSGLMQHKGQISPKRDMTILSQRQTRDYENKMKVLGVFPYNLEYLFYIIQGIYLLNLIMTSLKADGMKKKAKATDWIVSGSYLKTQ